MKGFGAAPKPNDGRYSPADQADLVYTLIKQRALRDVTLVGHSLGGGVALLTALRLLDEGAGRLSRMVILAGAAYRQRMPPVVRLAHWPKLCSLLQRLPGTRFMVRRVLRSIVHDPATVTRSQVEGYADPLRGAAARRALIDMALHIVPPDLDLWVARYPEIDVPTLLLWGDDDRVVPISIGQRLARELPRAQLTILEATGHLPAEERPRESLRVLESFLDGPTA